MVSVALCDVILAVGLGGIGVRCVGGDPVVGGPARRAALEMKLWLAGIDA